MTFRGLIKYLAEREILNLPSNILEIQFIIIMSKP